MLLEIGAGSPAIEEGGDVDIGEFQVVVVAAGDVRPPEDVVHVVGGEAVDLHIGRGGGETPLGIPGEEVPDLEGVMPIRADPFDTAAEVGLAVDDGAVAIEVGGFALAVETAEIQAKSALAVGFVILKAD